MEGNGSRPTWLVKKFEAMKEEQHRLDLAAALVPKDLESRISRLENAYGISRSSKTWWRNVLEKLVSGALLMIGAAAVAWAFAWIRAWPAIKSMAGP